jgi:3-hydroxyisobutyrate dehydrogenase
MKAGFIGLGNLGSAIARRLIDQGVDLTVWNRTKSKADKLDVKIEKDPAGLMSRVDILFICLSQSEAVESVLLGDDGVLKGDCQEKIIVDLTTNHFEQVVLFHDMASDADASYIESPVVGSVVPALKGALTVLVSGEKSAYEKALPFIEKFGNNIFYLEKKSLATKMKLINNLALGAFMSGVAEAVAYGQAAGLDRQHVLEILSVGGGKSGILDAKRQKLTDEDFSPQFSVAMMYKDLHIMQDLARALRRPLFTASMAKELFGMAIAQGLENDDFSAVYRVMK